MSKITTHVLFIAFVLFFIQFSYFSSAVSQTGNATITRNNEDITSNLTEAGNNQNLTFMNETAYCIAGMCEGFSDDYADPPGYSK